MVCLSDLGMEAKGAPRLTRQEGVRPGTDLRGKRGTNGWVERQ